MIRLDDKLRLFFKISMQIFTEDLFWTLSNSHILNLPGIFTISQDFSMKSPFTNGCPLTKKNTIAIAGVRNEIFAKNRRSYLI